MPGAGGERKVRFALKGWQIERGGVGGTCGVESCGQGHARSQVVASCLGYPAKFIRDKEARHKSGNSSFFDAE